MQLFGKQTARQKEIRRSKAERRPGWLLRTADRVRIRPLVLLLASAVLASVIINFGGDVPGYREGQVLLRSITSRVAFRVADEARTQIEKMRARDNADDYYALDTSLLTDIRGRLASALRVAREQGGDLQHLKESAAAIQIVLDDAGLEELARLAAQPDSPVYEHAVDRAVSVLRNAPLVAADEKAPRRTGVSAMLVDPNQATERPISINRLLFSSAADDVARVAEEAAAEFPAPLRPSMRASLLEMLRGTTENTFKAIYRRDSKASQEAAQRAEDKVQTQYVDYGVGSELADAGILTRAEVLLLNEEHKRFEELRDSGGNLALVATHRAALAGRALVTFLIVFGLGGFVLAQQQETRAPQTQPRVAMAVVLLALMLLARTIYLNTTVVYTAVGVQVFATALLAITARRVAAQYASGILALLITLATRQGASFLVILAAVSVVLFLGLRNVRNRGRIIAIGSLAALTALLVTVLVGLVEQQTLTFLFWSRALWAALTTLGAAFLFEGILPAIERLFNVTTDMTLLEWCDPNKPLLRMLAAESPGTYNHSLMVGALADAAADAIGANGLLARAGAYYHDIGKVNKPEYFVENQGMGVGNRHDRLSPAMSHLIIIGHVKDGVEMAKAYGLPARLHPFIPEHHGTTVIEYFYHAASQARKPGDPAVSDTQFRYPGPKPQSRETAIVMLCDGVEGAVRAMPEPTPNRIEDTVAKIIQKRLTDGQFDECDLTFKELAAIRQSLVKSLISIYHGRIAYPSSDEEEEEPRAQSAS
jgi:putative nucleotidyltransferase with HDIG domain